MEALPSEEIADHIVRLMTAALGHGPAINGKVLEAPL